MAPYGWMRSNVTAMKRAFSTAITKRHMYKTTVIMMKISALNVRSDKHVKMFDMTTFAPMEKDTEKMTNKPNSFHFYIQAISYIDL